MSQVKISRTSESGDRRNYLPDLFQSTNIQIKQLQQTGGSHPTAKCQPEDSAWPTRPLGRDPTANLLDLPPQASTPNSALVHQKASTVNFTSGNSTTVGDHLAAASVQAGASPPLMIGNRPKCVENLVEKQSQSARQRQNNSPAPSQLLAPIGPQNTALRAEQRRQNMSVSVVRPVVSVVGARLADNLSEINKQNSLIGDWMAFDSKYPNSETRAKGQATSIDELLLSIKTDGQKQHYDHNLDMTPTLHQAKQMRSEQEHRLQLEQHSLAMARREQHELRRNIGQQHQFLMDKLEERKRQLSIVQSVWVKHDFKHAIEMLVDIYHQGLVFTSNCQQPSKLKSLNTSLVVDVIGIVILRPKLWTLEICQLLLPIINQDLLVQSNQYEYYTEIGLKALKLILTQFSFIITSTLSSLKDSDKLVGIDLSREDRINKCLACYKLLLEAHSVILSQRQHKKYNSNATNQTQHKQQQNTADNLGKQCKLAAFQRELLPMFASMFSSIRLDSSALTRRFSS